MIRPWGNSNLMLVTFSEKKCYFPRVRTYYFWNLTVPIRWKGYSWNGLLESEKTKCNESWYFLRSTMNECWCWFGKLLTNILHIEQLYIMTCSLRTQPRLNTHTHTLTRTLTHTLASTLLHSSHKHIFESHTRTILHYTHSLTNTHSHSHTLQHTWRPWIAAKCQA